MHVSEAYQNRVAVMISGTPIPSTGYLCRTELYKSERNIGTEKHMAMASRAYILIDVARKTSYGRLRHICSSDEECCNS